MKLEQWFQHDGAPPHFSRNVQGILNRMYPNRWIGRGGPRHWPGRSPDLNPLDFFLWGYVKIVIYIRVRDVNFPARQLVSGTMAQPSA
jgi:hypothetical protein